MNRIIVTVCVFALGALILPTSVSYAKKPPLPTQKKQDLSQLKNRLQSEKHEKEELENIIKKAEKDLESVKNQLVKTGEATQANERILQSLQVRIKELEIKKNEQEEKLKKDYGAISDLIIALTRIRRVPTESLLFRPDAPYETAQSATLLRAILPTINKRAIALSVSLKELDTLYQELAGEKREALQTSATLEQKYSEIEALLKERKNLFVKTTADYEQTVARINKISRQAQSMQDLLNKLHQEEQRLASLRAPTKPESLAPPPRTGAPQLPIRGPVLVGFGQTDNIGAKSQGVRIQGISDGLVLAPMSGIARFAGEFKNYGRLIILEHRDGYHSLIGGLGTLAIDVGQKVNIGEPIGKLPKSPSREAQPALYYEIRYKGQPVNPAKLFSEIKT